MKKLLLTTALSVSLLTGGISYAADKTVTTDAKPGHHGKFLESLQKDKADLFRASMKESREKDKALFSQMKSLHEDLGKIVKASTFDEKAYIEKSTEIATLRNTIGEHKTQNMAGFLSKLNQDERTKFFDSMKKMKHKHHKNGVDSKATSDSVKK